MFFQKRKSHGVSLGFVCLKRRRRKTIQSNVPLAVLFFFGVFAKRKKENGASRSSFSTTTSSIASTAAARLLSFELSTFPFLLLSLSLSPSGLLSGPRDEFKKETPLDARPSKNKKGKKKRREMNDQTKDRQLSIRSTPPFVPLTQTKPSALALVIFLRYRPVALSTLVSLFLLLSLFLSSLFTFYFVFCFLWFFFFFAFVVETHFSPLTRGSLHGRRAKRNGLKLLACNGETRCQRV